MVILQIESECKHFAILYDYLLHYSGRSQVIAGKTIGVMTLFSLLLLIGSIESIGQVENIIKAHISECSFYFAAVDVITK